MEREDIEVGARFQCRELLGEGGIAVACEFLGGHVLGTCHSILGDQVGYRRRENSEVGIDVLDRPVC